MYCRVKNSPFYFICLFFAFWSSDIFHTLEAVIIYYWFYCFWLICFFFSLIKQMIKNHLITWWEINSTPLKEKMFSEGVYFLKPEVIFGFVISTPKRAWLFNKPDYIRGCFAANWLHCASVHHVWWLDFLSPRRAAIITNGWVQTICKTFD